MAEGFRSYPIKDAVKEYDLFVPLSDNSGKPVDSHRLGQLKRRLIDAFGGLTDFPQENEGFWKIGRVVFRDKIVILRVLSEDAQRAEQVFDELKSELIHEWGQKEVLIIAREVSTL